MVNTQEYFVMKRNVKTTVITMESVKMGLVFVRMDSLANYVNYQAVLIAVITMDYVTMANVNAK